MHDTEGTYSINHWNMSDEVFTEVAQVMNNVAERFNVENKKEQGNLKSFMFAIHNLHELTTFQEVKIISMEKRKFKV